MSGQQAGPVPLPATEPAPPVRRRTAPSGSCGPRLQGRLRGLGRPDGRLPLAAGVERKRAWGRHVTSIFIAWTMLVRMREIERASTPISSPELRL